MELPAFSVPLYDLLFASFAAGSDFSVPPLQEGILQGKHTLPGNAEVSI
jgi:hypothetical protein